MGTLLFILALFFIVAFIVASDDKGSDGSSGGSGDSAYSDNSSCGSCG